MKRQIKAFIGGFPGILANLKLADTWSIQVKKKKLFVDETDVASPRPTICLKRKGRTERTGSQGQKDSRFLVVTRPVPEACRDKLVSVASPGAPRSTINPGKS